MKRINESNTCCYNGLITVAISGRVQSGFAASSQRAYKSVGTTWVHGAIHGKTAERPQRIRCVLALNSPANRHQCDSALSFQNIIIKIMTSFNYVIWLWFQQDDSSFKLGRPKPMILLTGMADSAKTRRHTTRRILQLSAVQDRWPPRCVIHYRSLDQLHSVHEVEHH